jgi:hypothetical protein
VAVHRARGGGVRGDALAELGRADTIIYSFYQGGQSGSPLVVFTTSAHAVAGTDLNPISLTEALPTLGFVDTLVISTLGATAIPELASLTLLGIGAVGLIGYGWRR